MAGDEKRPAGVPSDFWDIASLVPPRARRGAYRDLPQRKADIGAPEISVPSPQGDPQGRTRANASHSLSRGACDASSTPSSSQKQGKIPTQGAQISPSAAAPLKEGQSTPQAPSATLDDVTVEPMTTPPVRVMSQTGTVMAGDVPLPRRDILPPEPTAVTPPERVYRPEDGFLREVRVFPFGRPHTYYATFADHAKRLKDLEGKEVPHVPFFSYMPQYTQLTRPQLAYYFWWRTSFRRGVALQADYSYLLLYLFEIINLGDEIDPVTGQESMQRLWLSYRAQYPRLDSILREWLCDYALIHGLAPLPLPEGQVRSLIAEARLKEFYLGTGKGEGLLDAVLAFSSNYDYHKSKFYRGEDTALFDRILRGAAKLALEDLMRENSAGEPPLGHSTITRESFSGAICTSRQKKRIEVDFLSFSHTYRLRYVLTDVLKYAENAIRAHLGVKSRLSVYEVPTDLRAALDAYLVKALPPKPLRTACKGAEPMPDYEKRYELPDVELSLERAAAIEADSWQTTKRLVEAFGGGESDAATPPRATVARTNNEKEPQTVSKTRFLAENNASVLARSDGPTVSGAPVAGTFTAALGALAPFLPLVARGDTAAMRAFSAQMGLMTDAVCDRINTVAGDVLGDVILEESMGTWRIIEDYRSDLEGEGLLS